MIEELILHLPTNPPRNPYSHELIIDPMQNGSGRAGPGGAMGRDRPGPDTPFPAIATRSPQEAPAA
jgi:hypothetical protein